VGELMAQGFEVEDAVEFVAEDTANEQRRFVRYGAKYCTKGGVRATVCNRRTGELLRNGRGYRTWSASSRWGDRMKAIRAAQKAWALTSGQSAQPMTLVAPGALDPDTDFYAPGEAQTILDEAAESNVM